MDSQKKPVGQFLQRSSSDSLKIALLIAFIVLTGVWISGHITPRTSAPNLATVYDATPKKLISTRISANILETQIPILLDNRLPLWQGLGLTNYYFSSAPGTKNSSDVAILNTFAGQTGAHIDTLFDMPNMTNADMDSQIANFHPEYIQFNQESQDGKNGIANDLYSTLATSFMSYLNNRAVPVLDGALVYRDALASIARKDTVAPLTGTYDVRQYIQINDIVGYTTDMNANAAKLNDYFTNMSVGAESLPAFLNKFFVDYPHARKEAVIQWNVEDFTDRPFVLGTNLSNSAMGRTVEFVLRNTDRISYLAWMSLGNLVNQAAHQINTPKPEYYSLQRLATLFRYKYEQDFNAGLPGVTSLLFSNDDGTSALLVNNPTGSQYTIAGSNFPNVVGGFSRSTGWATSWTPPATNEVVTETAAITVRPYSVSVIKFTVSEDSTGTDSGNTNGTDTTAPGIGEIRSRTGLAGASINWRTDEAASSILEFGTTPSYGSTTPEIDTNPRVTHHRINIAGLVGGTVYHYRVKSTDAAGNIATSGDQTFMTLAQS